MSGGQRVCDGKEWMPNATYYARLPAGAFISPRYHTLAAVTQHAIEVCSSVGWAGSGCLQEVLLGLHPKYPHITIVPRFSRHFSPSLFFYPPID
jgi:hypothetical protein